MDGSIHRRFLCSESVDNGTVLTVRSLPYTRNGVPTAHWACWNSKSILLPFYPTIHLVKQIWNCVKKCIYPRLNFAARLELAGAHLHVRDPFSRCIHLDEATGIEMNHDTVFMAKMHSAMFESSRDMVRITYNPDSLGSGVKRGPCPTQTTSQWTTLTGNDVETKTKYEKKKKGIQMLQCFEMHTPNYTTWTPNLGARALGIYAGESLRRLHLSRQTHDFITSGQNKEKPSFIRENDVG